jgi:hypothetical protein
MRWFMAQQFFLSLLSLQQNFIYFSASSIRPLIFSLYSSFIHKNRSLDVLCALTVCELALAVMLWLQKHTKKRLSINTHVEHTIATPLGEGK